MDSTWLRDSMWYQWTFLSEYMNIKKGFKNANSTRKIMLSQRSFELRTLSPLTRTPSMNATWCVKASALRRSLDVPARRTCEVRTLSPLSRAPSMNATRCVKASTSAMSRRSKQMHSRQFFGMDISISRQLRGSSLPNAPAALSRCQEENSGLQPFGKRDDNRALRHRKVAANYHVAHTE